MGMYVNYSETYGAVLERRLNEREGPRWEFSMLPLTAIPFSSWRYLKYGVQYEPDIVVMSE